MAYDVIQYWKEPIGTGGEVVIPSDVPKTGRSCATMHVCWMCRLVCVHTHFARTVCRILHHKKQTRHRPSRTYVPLNDDSSWAAVYRRKPWLPLNDSSKQIGLSSILCHLKVPSYSQQMAHSTKSDWIPIERNHPFCIVWVRHSTEGRICLYLHYLFVLVLYTLAKRFMQSGCSRMSLCICLCPECGLRQEERRQCSQHIVFSSFNPLRTSREDVKGRRELFDILCEHLIIV